MRRIGKTRTDYMGQQVPPSEGCKWEPATGKIYNFQKLQPQQYFKSGYSSNMKRKADKCYMEGANESERGEDLDSGGCNERKAKCLRRDDGST